MQRPDEQHGSPISRVQRDFDVHFRGFWNRVDFRASWQRKTMFLWENRKRSAVNVRISGVFLLLNHMVGAIYWHIRLRNAITQCYLKWLCFSPIFLCSVLWHVILLANPAIELLLALADLRNRKQQNDSFKLISTPTRGEWEIKMTYIYVYTTCKHAICFWVYFSRETRLCKRKLFCLTNKAFFVGATTAGWLDKPVIMMITNYPIFRLNALCHLKY